MTAPAVMAPSLERLGTCDLEELDFLRGWVDNQRADPSWTAEERAEVWKVRRRLLERIEQARQRHV